jgi:hypothetical protein
MIVTTGRHIKVEVLDFIFERTAETPGLVVLTTKKGSIGLPANQEDMARVIEAYHRVCEEDVAYRKSNCE